MYSYLKRFYAAAMQIIWFCRVLLFYSLLLPLTIIFALIALLTFPFPFVVRYWIITRWSHIFIFLSKIICGLQYKIHGIENTPKKNCIIVSNHQSMWETIFMQVLFPQQNMILKKELLRIPFFGWGLSLLEPIALDRKNFRSVNRVLEQGFDRLKKGRFVLLFPEGTRLPYGHSGRYSRTAAALAIKSGFPILPDAHNAGKYWPKGFFIKQPGIIEVTIGPQVLETSGNLDVLTETIKSWITSHIH